MSSSHPIRIDVRTLFLDDQSDVADNQYAFAYHISIRNESGETVQLLARHWLISDMHGEVREVKGEGVVGEQPTLLPGQEFDYTSGVTLNTPQGRMHGSYQFVTEAGEAFVAPIPAFELSMPRKLH